MIVHAEERSELAQGDIFSNNGYEAFGFDSTDNLRFQWRDAYSVADYAVEADNVKFRDLSAWYNIVVKFDTTQATATDRVSAGDGGRIFAPGDTVVTPWGRGNIVGEHGLAGCSGASHL